MRPTFDLVQFVYATGVITGSTPESLRRFAQRNRLVPGAYVIFNSPGGSLLGGMRLGNVIRSLRFDTMVGTRGEPDSTALNIPRIKPGACYSACTLAYLGGRYRYWTEGSTFGVHRFSSTEHSKDDLDTAQIISSDIVRYIERMGVSSALFDRMSDASPDTINDLSVSEMRALHVISDAAEKESWELKTVPPGAIYLVATHVDERGTGKMIFVCGRKTHTLGSLILIPEPSASDAQSVVPDIKTAGFFVDDDVHPLTTFAKVNIHVVGSNIDVIWNVSPADVTRMTSARSETGFALEFANKMFFTGFRIHFGANGKALLRDYASDCMQ
jgi:hypothetical protein